MKLNQIDSMTTSLHPSKESARECREFCALPFDAKRFAIDYSLSKIAKYIRLLGYDVYCDKGTKQRELLHIASREERAVITCSGAFAEQIEAHNRAVHRLQARRAPAQKRVVAYDSDGDSIYASSSEDGGEVAVPLFYIQQWNRRNFQSTLVELIAATSLMYFPDRVFSRCVTCNDALVEVDKALVQGRVVPAIYRMYDGFTECPVCKKVFWGYMGEDVLNYKSYRTLELLRSLCRSAGVNVVNTVATLHSLRSFRSFPRHVKTTVFSFLDDAALCTMSKIFPVLADLAAEVQMSRMTGCPVASFKLIKTCK